MKKLLLFLLLISSLAHSQQRPVNPFNTALQVQGFDALKVEKFFELPPFQSFPSYVQDAIKDGALSYRTSDKQVMKYNALAGSWEALLGNYVPYTGATSTVDLSGVLVKAGQLQTPLIAGPVGFNLAVTSFQNISLQTSSGYTQIGTSSSNGLKLGYNSSLGAGGIWDYGVTPSATNYALTTGTSYTQINSPTSGGNIFLSFGGSNGAQITQNGFSMLGYLEATSYPSGIAGTDRILVQGSSGGIFGSPIKSIPASSYILSGSTRISVTAGASNPVTVTYSSYSSTYGDNPRVFFYEQTSAGVYRLRTDVQPIYNTTGTTINSIEFDFGIVPNGYILITH